MNKKHVIRTTILLFIASALTSIVSFARESVFANYFGVSSEADAYIIAIQLPVIIFAVISTALTTVVIPLYSEKYYKDGKAQADGFFSNLLTLVLVGSSPFAIMGIIFADAIIYIFAPGLSVATHSLAASLIRITFPAIV